MKFQTIPITSTPTRGTCGETREVRLLEFVAANPRRYAVGLREGCMLRYENGRLELLGSPSDADFQEGTDPLRGAPGDDLSFLL